jgi:hypothetical protein
MPRAYSTDLRERVLAAYGAGEGSQATVARRCRVGERTLSLDLPRHEIAPQTAQTTLTLEQNDEWQVRYRYMQLSRTWPS